MDVSERKKRKALLCGLCEEKKATHIYHLDRTANNDPVNLFLVCADCYKWLQNNGADVDTDDDAETDIFGAPKKWRDKSELEKRRWTAWMGTGLFLPLTLFFGITPLWFFAAALIWWYWWRYLGLKNKNKGE